MNLEITLQTLRCVERLLDGWLSSGDIPAIERDLACDMLRRAYDGIYFLDKRAATAPEAPLAENTPADRTNEEAVSGAPDTSADTAAAAADTTIADMASPVGLAGFAPSVETSEESPEELPENAEAVAEPATEPATEPTADPAPIDVPAEVPAEEDTSVETPVDEPASVEETAEEENPVEESVEEDTPANTSVGEVAEEVIPVEEFGETEAGDAVEESGDTVSPAEDVATSIPDTSADIVIDPVFEVFTDEDGEMEAPDGTETPEDAEEQEDAEMVEAVDLAETVNVVDAVEAVGAAEDTEIAEEMEVVEVAEDMEVEEMDAEEPEVGRTVAVPAVMQPATATAAAAETEPESALAAAPAETSTGQTPADAAAANAETLEEMAARFKNASGRRRKSRRAFMSLYDDDETFRRGAQSDQLELSDWGVEPSDTSAKLRHTRELFGLPADDPDTTAEPTPQSATEADAADDEMEVIDFVGDDDFAQSNRTAKPTSEPTAAPIAPTPRPAVAPALGEQDDAEEDQPFDSIEIVEINDSDEETPEVEEYETQHTDRTEVTDEPARSEAAAPAASATESAAVHTLYGHEEKPDLPASTTVLGEVMGHDVPTVGDTLGHRPDVAGWTEVADDLNHAISVGDRFVLLRDLFDGDQALCDRTLKRLSTFDDLDDCMIWITENFAWNANSEGAKLIMGLLERKLG